MHQFRFQNVYGPLNVDFLAGGGNAEFILYITRSPE